MGGNMDASVRRRYLASMSVGGGSWSLGHRAELDGLRGLAVIAVMLGHGYVRGFEGGGAVGVAVFFTLSGFLITALLLEERNDTGRISTRSFWRRRPVRLLPALGVVMLVGEFTVLPSPLELAHRSDGRTTGECRLRSRSPLTDRAYGALSASVQMPR